MEALEDRGGKVTGQLITVSPSSISRLFNMVTKLALCNRLFSFKYIMFYPSMHAVILFLSLKYWIKKFALFKFEIKLPPWQLENIIFNGRFVPSLINNI